MPKFLEGKLMIIFILLIIGVVCIFSAEDTKKTVAGDNDQVNYTDLIK